MSYNGSLQLEYIDGKTWRLLEPVYYVHGKGDGMKTVTVPKGYTSDLATVPWLFIRVLPRTTGGHASIVHDWLTTRKRFDDWTPCDRATADEIFFIILKETNVPVYYRYPMYWGVRAWAKIARLK